MTNLSDYVGTAGFSSGSFNPAFQNESHAPSNQWGEWYKIGDMAFVNCYFEWASLTQSLNSVRISGWPSSIQPAFGDYYMGTIARAAGVDFGAVDSAFPTQLGLIVDANNYMTLYLNFSIGTNISGGQSNIMTYSQLATSGLFQVSGNWRVL